MLDKRRVTNRLERTLAQRGHSRAPLAATSAASLLDHAKQSVRMIRPSNARFLARVIAADK